MPSKFTGGQRVRWTSEAFGGEQKGYIHCAYPKSWPNLKSDEVPVVTNVALIMVDPIVLQLDI